MATKQTDPLEELADALYQVITKMPSKTPVQRPRPSIRDMSPQILKKRLYARAKFNEGINNANESYSGENMIIPSIKKSFDLEFCANAFAKRQSEYRGILKAIFAHYNGGDNVVDAIMSYDRKLARRKWSPRLHASLAMFYTVSVTNDAEVLSKAASALKTYSRRVAGAPVAHAIGLTAKRTYDPVSITMVADFFNELSDQPYVDRHALGLSHIVAHYSDRKVLSFMRGLDSAKIMRPY